MMLPICSRPGTTNHDCFTAVSSRINKYTNVLCMCSSIHTGSPIFVSSPPSGPQQTPAPRNYCVAFSVIKRVFTIFRLKPNLAIEFNDKSTDCLADLLVIHTYSPSSSKSNSPMRSRISGKNANRFGIQRCLALYATFTV